MIDQHSTFIHCQVAFTLVDLKVDITTTFVHSHIARHLIEQVRLQGILLRKKKDDCGITVDAPLLPTPFSVTGATSHFVSLQTRDWMFSPTQAWVPRCIEVVRHKAYLCLIMTTSSDAYCHGTIYVHALMLHRCELSYSTGSCQNVGVQILQFLCPGTNTAKQKNLWSYKIFREIFIRCFHVQVPSEHTMHRSCLLKVDRAGCNTSA